MEGKKNGVHLPDVLRTVLRQWVSFVVWRSTVYAFNPYPANVENMVSS